MIVLIGESGSGKTTLVKALQDNYGMKSIVTYTTRPPRDGEVDGIDYHFIDKTEFLSLLHNGFFAETAEYRGWWYGSAASDYDDNTVAVLTPHGLRQITKKFALDENVHVVSFYIDIPRRDRLIRLLQRGDDIEEAYRRSLSDVGQFDGVFSETTFHISNPRYIGSPDEVARDIWELYVDAI